MAGKVSSATEFNTKIVPSETDISSSVAPMMGPTAAIALPPQIAVPVEMRNAGRGRTDISLPSSGPDNHGEGDAHRGVEKSAAAGLQHLLQVHAEAQAHHRGLQQILRELSRFVLDRDGWRWRRR